jgi:nickel/cobalt transporter (NicO) family protein
MAFTRRTWVSSSLAICFALGSAGTTRADTVASLLGNFTINQFSGLRVADDAIEVHYAVVFGQLPALRELHEADTDHNGVTSQEERDVYVARLAQSLAQSLEVRVDGGRVPLRASHWSSSLPKEQAGFSLRVEVYFDAALTTLAGGARRIDFANHNYAGRLGWNEITVDSGSEIAIFDTSAYSTSLTGGLIDALQSLPDSGPLNERAARFEVARTLPPGAKRIAPRPGTKVSLPATLSSSDKSSAPAESAWISLKTRQLIDSISAPQLTHRVIALALLAALLLGAVHALSPGHGKTIVGAYLIGSRGTPRHAVFLGATVTITHTVGVFLLGFATLYASQYIVPEKLFPLLSLVSALLVFSMGGVLLVQRVWAARRTPIFYLVGTMPATPTRMHSHGGGPLHSHLPPGAAGERVTWRSLLTLGISGGLVPCPSAMVLLLAAVALNKTAFGMLLVVAFSVGLAITLTAVGLAFLYARNRLPRARPGARWPRLLPVASAATITLLGVALCVGALKSFAS